MLTAKQKALDYLRRALEAEELGDHVAASCLLEIAASWELEG